MTAEVPLEPHRSTRSGSGLIQVTVSHSRRSASGSILWSLMHKHFQKLLEFLVRPHGVFIGGYLSAPLAVVKVMK